MTTIIIVGILIALFVGGIVAVTLPDNPRGVSADYGGGRAPDRDADVK